LGVEKITTSIFELPVSWVKTNGSDLKLGISYEKITHNQNAFKGLKNDLIVFQPKVELAYNLKSQSVNILFSPIWLAFAHLEFGVIKEDNLVFSGGLEFDLVNVFTAFLVPMSYATDKDGNVIRTIEPYYRYRIFLGDVPSHHELGLRFGFWRQTEIKEQKEDPYRIKIKI